jgi:hypothetical protein
VNVINTTLGTIHVNGMLAATSFPTNAGIISIAAAGTLGTGNASLTNEVGATIHAAAGGTLNLGAGGSFNNNGTATFQGAYDVATTNVAAGTVTLNGTASTATLNLSGGTVTGAGDLSVTTDFNQTGGTLGATFGDLVLHKAGNFTVGAAGITAVDSVKLIAAGDITLNGAVAATNGTGDAIVLAAGGNFFNNVGFSVLNPGSGRWLVYSTSPGGSFENGLTGVADPSLPRLYGRTYPGTVAESGNHLLYSARPTLAVTPDNKTKVYGADDPAQTYEGTGFDNDDGVIDTAAMAGVGGSFSRAAGESVGSHAIMQGTFASSAGYQVAFTGGRTLAIQSKSLTVTADSQTKMFDAADPTLSFQASGLVSASATDWNGNVTAINDTAGTALTGALARNSGETVGFYAINQGTLASANYTIGFTGNNLSITPDPGNFRWTGAGPILSWSDPANWNQGVLPVANSIVTIPGLTAGDTIVYAGGTTSLVSISSTASFNVTGGTLNLSGTGTNASSFPSLTLAGGTLGGNGTINAPTLSVLAGGVLGGSRIINGDVSNLGGVVAMGASPGTITVNGSYTQSALGTLLAEVAGNTPGSQYDQLIVNGNTSLDGTLRVNLLGGFVPADGATFTVVQSSGPLTGAFASTSFPSSPAFSAGYLPASMFVSVSGVILPPPGAIASASQVVVALTDQNQNTLVASQATGAPIDGQGQPQQQEREELQRKPMCNASNEGGGGDGGGGGLMGGGGFRCNTRGCF